MTESKCNAPIRDKNADMMINGKISAAVWYLAWPMIINTLIQSAYNLINRLFLGGLSNSDAAQAAVGISGSILNAQLALTSGLSIGTAALVSRFLGAQEREDAEEATRQAMMLGVLIAIIYTTVTAILARPLVTMAGAQHEVIPLASKYLTTVAMGALPLFLTAVCVAALRSMGDAKSLLYAGAVTIGLNILFDWLLIIGPGPFPAMGLQGAAIATNIARVAGTAIMIWFLYRSSLSKALSRFQPHGQWFWRILRIGLPAAMPGLSWAGSLALFIRMTEYLPHTTAVQAALTVGMTIETICFMPGSAYTFAVTPLVGQNLGAGKIKRAEKAAWTAAAHAAVVMSVIALAFLFIPKTLAAPFTRKPMVAGLIASYLSTVAFRQPFLAIGIVFIGALQGAGDTIAPMIVELIVNWPVRLGLAWLLAIHLGYGAKGLWIAMAAPSLLYGLLCAGWFKRGTWKNSSV